MQKQISYKIVSLVFSVLVLCFAVAFYAVGGWNPPSAAPPEGNVLPPLNTGSIGQEKIGGLILNTGGATNGLIVDQGNVGIGTVNPQAKLHVAGTAGTDGIMFPDGTIQTTGLSSSYNEIESNNDINQNVNLANDSYVFLTAYGLKTDGLDGRCGMQIRIDGVTCSGDRENVSGAAVGYGQYMSAACIEVVSAGNHTFSLINAESDDLFMRLQYLIIPIF